MLVGAVFALAAYGLALVWGVTNVKNLAQGDFVMLGGYLAYTFAENGLHPFIALASRRRAHVSASAGSSTSW